MDLDKFSTKYFSDPRLEIENYLMMNEYPKIIYNSIGKVEHLLELGIGHGYTTTIFEKFCHHHHVVEGSSTIIENFNTNYPDCRSKITQTYFENFESNDKYDAIIMGFVLEHVPNPVEILKKYKSFLKAGGKLFVVVPNAKSLNRRMGLEMGIISDIYELNSTDHILGHLRNYCPETLEKDIISAGLKLSNLCGIYLKPLPLSVLQKLDDFDGNMQAMIKLGYDFPELSVAMLAEVQK